MRQAYLLLNHPLTDRQTEELRSTWQAERIHPLPEGLRALWAQVPPAGSLDPTAFTPLTEWLTAAARPGDTVVVQGEFGATFYLVDFCFQHGLVPIYATTRRDSREDRMPDGSVRNSRIFSHVIFRPYKRWKKKE